MKPTTPLKLDPDITYAVQNAKEGLINVADLSRLTGVDVGQLNKFAKMGCVTHYGEYHGKRFYNFQEIINWLVRPGDHTEAKPVIRAKMEEMLQKKNCPYSLDKPDANDHVRIVWKELA